MFSIESFRNSEKQEKQQWQTLLLQKNQQQRQFLYAKNKINKFRIPIKTYIDRHIHTYVHTYMFIHLHIFQCIGLKGANV